MIAEKSCTGPLHHGALLEISKFKQDWTGKAYNKECNDCMRHRRKTIAENHLFNKPVAGLSEVEGVMRTPTGCLLSERKPRETVSMKQEEAPNVPGL